MYSRQNRILEYLKVYMQQMPYSINCSQTCIYPGTTQTMSTHGHYSVNYQHQTNGRDLISYRCQPDISSYSINAKPIYVILLANDVNTDTNN